MIHHGDGHDRVVGKGGLLGEEFEVVAGGVVPLVDASDDVSGDGSQHDVLLRLHGEPASGAKKQESSPGWKSFLLLLSWPLAGWLWHLDHCDQVAGRS